jgi:drug/metabolite transporter (DMT)-like permease
LLAFTGEREMANEYLWIALVAITWGGYPLVTRASGHDGPLSPLLLALTSLVPIAAAVFWQGAAVRPQGSAILLLCIAGLLQGIGLAAFLRVANGPMDASVSIPISDGAMLLVTAIGAVLFFGEPLTARKLAGLALLVLGIALLRPAPH